MLAEESLTNRIKETNSWRGSLLFGKTKQKLSSNKVVSVLFFWSLTTTIKYENESKYIPSWNKQRACISAKRIWNKQRLGWSDNSPVAVDNQARVVWSKREWIALNWPVESSFLACSLINFQQSTKQYLLVKGLLDGKVDSIANISTPKCLTYLPKTSEGPHQVREHDYLRNWNEIGNQARVLESTIIGMSGFSSITMTQHESIPKYEVKWVRPLSVECEVLWGEIEIFEWW